MSPLAALRAADDVRVPAGTPSALGAIGIPPSASDELLRDWFAPTSGGSAVGSPGSPGAFSDVFGSGQTAAAAGILIY